MRRTHEGGEGSAGRTRVVGETALPFEKGSVLDARKEGLPMFVHFESEILCEPD
jgi:hypothetical protein